MKQILPPSGDQVRPQADDPRCDFVRNGQNLKHHNSRGQYKRLPLLTTLDKIFFAVTIFGVAMVPLASRKERLWKDLAPLADRSLPAIQVNMAGHHHH